MLSSDGSLESVNDDILEGAVSGTWVGMRKGFNGEVICITHVAA